MPYRLLVAGIGNIFLGDGGFGVEVVKRLSAETLPEWVLVADFGIRGIHLAYDLLDRSYETLILVDALPRGGAPGTVYILDPVLDGFQSAEPNSADAHCIDPETVFSLLTSVGGMPPRVLIVGCEPARMEETIGLSEPVAQAVEDAVQIILALLCPRNSNRAIAV